MHLARIGAATFIIFFLLLYSSSSHPKIYPLVNSGSSWKSATEVPAAAGNWRVASYNDSLWEITKNPMLRRSSPRVYLRHTFEFSKRRDFASLLLRLPSELKFGGVYINGTEVFKSKGRASDSSSRWHEVYADAELLIQGKNVLAVEALNTALSSRPVEIELMASETARVIRGPYLQKGTRGTMTIRWRTDVPTNSRVRYSKQPTALNNVKDNSTVTKEHAVTLTGLPYFTRYFYTVGTTAIPLSTPVSFVTNPDNGHPIKARFWVLGDSGTATPGAKAVRNAYYLFTGGTYTNLMLMLGGNAYLRGTDADYQRTLFTIYAAALKRTVMWPAIGEQDTAGVKNPVSSIPYFMSFDLPRNGEGGGVPSGTEDYYSFNYGAIHFVCLDSVTSNRLPTGAMLIWLKKDLAANKNPWIIAYWHHPPYSKGSHDSDRELPMIEMRQHAARILEYYGVDLILGAHSNSYERTYLINGHYGFSSSFTAAMIRNRGSGRGAGAYVKPLRGNNTGTVYAVVGSSGKTAPGTFNHPAMFIELNQLGSMIIDINANRLDAKFLRVNGTIGDYFSIIKSGRPPVVRITAPASGARFRVGSRVNISAAAHDPDGRVRKVAFYAGGKLLSTDHKSPYAITWSNVPRGSHSLTAVAEDDIGMQKRSAAQVITVH